MSVEINKTRVGAFVVGGLLLLVVGVVALGGKKFFANDFEYVLYFDGSVSGLSLGAPVVFRGVPLGNVTKISLVANQRDEGVTIPVYISIDERNIVRLGQEGPVTDAIRAEIISRMVLRGLRARLQLQSFITGQYRVELDFFPDMPARYHASDHDLEIPTVPSPLDEFQRTLSRLPLEDIATAFHSALHGIAKLANNEDIYASIAAFRGTLENAQQLLADTQPLRDDLRRVINTLNATAGTLDRQMPEAVAAFQLAMNGLAAAASQMDRTLASVDGIISRDSRTVRDLNQALKEFNETARAVRALATMLERHPESLLLGKRGNK